MARILNDWLQTKDPELNDELRFILKHLRMEIYTLMNYILRHEIFLVKWHTTEKLYKKYKTAEEKFELRIPTPEAITENFRKYIEGAEPIQNPTEGTYSIKEEPDRQFGLGFGRQYFLVCKTMEVLKKLLEEDLTDEPKIEHFADEAEKQAGNEMNSMKINYHLAKIDEYYTRFKGGAVNRARVVTSIKADLWFLLDMYNLYGDVKRGGRYAKSNSKPWLCTYKFKKGKGPRDNPQDVVWEIDWNSVKRGERDNKEHYYEVDGEHEHYLVEVDTYGYSCSDINKIQLGKEKIPLRKWDNKDITYLNREKPSDTRDNFRPRWNHVLEGATKDWQYFVDDLEKGGYHPYSRVIQDYNELIAKGRYDFDSATFKGILNFESTAFDRESLKVPNMVTYWGRKNYFNTSRENLLQKPFNPYPWASIYGLVDFINTMATKEVGQENAQRYLKYFKMNYPHFEGDTHSKGGGGHD